MVQYVVLFGIAFAVFGLFMLVFIARDRSGRKGAPAGCCGGSQENTACRHCSKPIRIPDEEESKERIDGASGDGRL
jgi:hypothetical protein